MDFITENLLTILILLPVFGALALLGHQMFWKQEGRLEMGDAWFHARQFSALAVPDRRTRERLRPAVSFSNRTCRGSRR